MSREVAIEFRAWHLRLGRFYKIWPHKLSIFSRSSRAFSFNEKKKRAGFSILEFSNVKHNSQRIRHYSIKRNIVKGVLEVSMFFWRFSSHVWCLHLGSNVAHLMPIVAHCFKKSQWNRVHDFWYIGRFSKISQHVLDLYFRFPIFQYPAFNAKEILGFTLC